MDLQAARRFIQNHGDPAEQARLRFTTIHAPASEEIRTALLVDQHRDGGFPPLWTPDYSSLDATCFRLAQARQVGLGSAQPEIALALRFLSERQASTGRWEEDASVADITPSWVTPGEEAAQLYLTANCGYRLAMMGNDLDSAKLAASYLRNKLLPSGQLPSYVHTHWLAAGLWVRMGEIRTTERIFAYLLTRLPELTSSGCAWMIVTLREAGLTPGHDLIQNALPVITSSQQSDGRWASEEGPARDVHATLEALHALTLCGA